MVERIYVKVPAHVWVIRFVEEPDMRVAASAEQAYEICRKYIKDEADITLDSIRQQCLDELAEQYRDCPDWFGCEDVCYVEEIKVEGA